MEFDTPLISIIVPVYNSAEYIGQCIESLSTQTYNNLEIIIVNDGSTDSSLTICQYHQSLDNRIIIIDQENQGVSQARNKGITEARGDYIGFVDSDDFIDIRMYKEMLNKIQLEDTQCAALINFTVRPRDNKKTDSYAPIESATAIEELFLLRFPTSMWAYLYEANIIKSITLSKDIHFFEDFEFNYKVLRKCKYVSICNEVFYQYRKNLLSVNHQEINDRKVSCLMIHEKIKNDMYVKNDKDLYQKSLFFKSNFIISMIISLASSSNDKQKFYNEVVRNQLDGFIIELVKSTYIPFLYKPLLIAFNISPKTTIKAMIFSEKHNIRKFGLNLN